MNYATPSPIPQYFDTDGSPLDGGSIYFGVAGENPETNPITVYWDAAGTQPAAQPIRTLNGFPVRGGNPAQIFASGAYSQTVRSRRGRLIFYGSSAQDQSAFLASPPPIGIDTPNIGAFTTISGDGSAITNLNAAALAGTIPNAAFPSILPAVSGVNLINLNASLLASGTIPGARFPATLPAGVTVPAAQLSGDVAGARIAAAFTANNSANGHITFPNGTIFQWGNATVTGNSTLAVTLPTAFPNNFFQAFATMDNNDTSVTNRVGAGIVSLSQIRLQNSTGTTPIRWWAVGN